MTPRSRRPVQCRDDAARSALDRARTLLSRRPLTRSEVRSWLLRERYGPDEADEALDRLQEVGLIDDARLAAHFLLTRADRLRRGPSRLLSELEARGVDPGVARAAWERAVRDGDLDPAAQIEREVARRIAAAGGRLDRRGYARVYNALLRAGFEPGAVESALSRYRDGFDD